MNSFVPILSFTSQHPEETCSFAAQCAERVRQYFRNNQIGFVIALNGPLGAGKSFFVRSFLQAAGVGGIIASPTFTLINEYVMTVGNKTFPVHHADFYRLSDESEIIETGIESILHGGGLVFTEWGNTFPVIMDNSRWIIDIVITGEEARRFSVLERS